MKFVCRLHNCHESYATWKKFANKPLCVFSCVPSYTSPFGSLPSEDLSAQFADCVSVRPRAIPYTMMQTAKEAARRTWVPPSLLKLQWIQTFFSG